MKQSNTLSAITATLIFIGLGVPASTLANIPGKFEEFSTMVAYADLNLEKEAGVQVLYLRLKRASREVCGVSSTRNAGSVSQKRHVRNCYSESLTEAVEEIDNDLLTRIHAG